MGGTNLLHKISLAQGQASAERSLATVSATRGIYKLLSDKGPRDERSIPTFPIVHKFWRRTSVSPEDRAQLC